MSNPYLSPSFDPKQFQDYSSPFPPPQNTGFGWVQQIRVVAILNCVQGGLESLAGTFFTGIGIFAAIMMMTQRNNPAFRNGNGPPAGMEWLVGGLYVVIGVPLLLAGILRIYAGLQNFQYRSRVLGIISFVCGAVSVFTCYCAPTAIGMLIYGLLVYLNPAVQAAFEMGNKGVPADAIVNSFLPYPPQQFGQPQNYGQPPFQPPPSPPQA